MSTTASDIDDLLDTSDLVADCEDQVESAPQESPKEEGSDAAPRTARAATTFMVLDIETVPDFEREATFTHLPPVPEEKPEDDPESLLSPEEFVSQTLDECRKYLESHNPPAEWLREVETAESEKPGKTRAGLASELEKALARKLERQKIIQQRNKMMSLDPACCRICCISLAVGSGQVSTIIARNEREEHALLEEFWRFAAKCRPLIGFNLLRFDLPVILVRSAMLGVAPPFRLNLSRYNQTDVIDLMEVIPLSGGLGAIYERLTGKPAGDGDGSMVLGWVQQGRWDILLRYCEQDVEITREVYQRFGSGFFCD